MENAHEISLQEAIDLTTRYRANQPAGCSLSETFQVDAIEKLISAGGCKFLRIYFGMKENGNVVTILVAANEDNEDILPGPDTLTTTEPVILEDGFVCPPLCPKPSPLNS